jgi:hypothetical protein
MKPALAARVTYRGRNERKGKIVRKLIIAVSAAALTVPTMVVPNSSAEAAYRTWRGKDGRIYCRRPNGTTGLLIGGAAGALVGRALDGGRSHATGTILGAAGGALLGREVQRSHARQRCVSRYRR